jgi:hypothetical protein
VIRLDVSIKRFVIQSDNDLKVYGLFGIVTEIKGAWLGTLADKKQAVVT